LAGLGDLGGFAAVGRDEGWSGSSLGETASASFTSGSTRVAPLLPWRSSIRRETPLDIVKLDAEREQILEFGRETPAHGTHRDRRARGSSRHLRTASGWHRRHRRARARCAANDARCVTIDGPPIDQIVDIADLGDLHAAALAT